MNALQEAQSVQQISAIIANSLDQRSERVSLLTGCLLYVLPRWRHQMAAEQLDSLVLRHFDRRGASLVDAVLALDNAWRRCDEHSARAIVPIAERFFTLPDVLVRRVLTTVTSDDVAVVVRALWRMPSLVSNALRTAPPNWLRQPAFAELLVRESVQESSVSVQSAVVEQAVLLGHVASVARVLASRVAAWPEARVAQLLNELSDDCGERVVHAVLMHVGESGGERSIPWPNAIPTQTAALEHYFSSKMWHGARQLQLSSKRRTNAMLEKVAAWLNAGEQHNALLRQVCLDLARVWGRKQFAEESTPQTEAYVSHALFVLIPMTLTQKSLTESTALRHLMQGVQVRLNSAVRPVRLNGMRIAQQFSKLLDKENPLKFEEYEKEEEEEEEEEEEMESEEEEKVEQDEEQDEMEQQTFRSKQTDYFVVVDPDQLVLNDDDAIGAFSLQNAPEEGDSDDEFEAFGLDESDDEADGCENVHFSQVVAGLHEDRDALRFESSLRQVSVLLRAGIDDVDFGETSASVARLLVHIPNRFDLDCFVQCRLEALVALCVSEPRAVGRFLTKTFYSDNLDVQQRIVILEALAGAARELAGFEKSANERAADAVAPKIQVVSTAGREIRRSKALERTKTLDSECKFRPVASEYFFGLLQKIDERTDHLNLMAGNELLMGQLIHCAAVLIECAGALHDNLLPMARVLLQLALVCRFRSEPFVRRAVVYAVAATLAVTHGSGRVMRGSQLAELIGEARQWLADTTNDDPDQQTRQMAATLIDVYAIR